MTCLKRNPTCLQSKPQKRGWLEALKLSIRVMGMVFYLITISSDLLSAQESQFARVVVSNLISLDVPRYWKMRDEFERKDIAAAAEARIGASTHVASLSVVSQPVPSGGILRVSFVGNGGLTQDDFRREVSRDKLGVLSELNQMSVEMLRDLNAGFQKIGARVLSGPEIGLLQFGDKMAFSLSYRRSGENASSYRVTQYHVPLEVDKAIITLSFREQDGGTFAPILDKVKASIKFLR